MIRQILTSLIFFSITTTHASAEAVPVKIVPGVGITRGGEPYFVKGAAGDKHLDELVAAGGNSFRTWTTNGLGPILNDAQQRGLTVCAGIWLESECSWFSYSNAEHCARQKERVKKEVLQYRDHPALLFWGIGNEAEGDGNNMAYWIQLEVLAKAVKELDPAHPSFTALAGLQPLKIAGLNALTPSLDFVGVNTYGALTGLRSYLAERRWKRPWVVTEYGPRGFWESPRAPLGSAHRANEHREGPIHPQSLSGRNPTRRRLLGRLCVSLGSETGGHIDMVWHLYRKRRIHRRARCDA